MTLVAVAVIVFLAAVAQATTGFGYALIAVPLLTLATDPRTAVVGAALASLLLTVALATRERASVRWRVTGWLLAASLVGMPVGLVILRYLPDRWLTALIAATALCCTVLVWRRLRLSIGPVSVSCVGVVTGVLTTATGTNGPPLVAAFQAMGYDARTFRATISAVFTGTGVLGLLGFFAAGQVTPSAAMVGLVGVPATALGWFVGERAFRRFDEERFRGVVLGALVVICAVTLARAIWPAK
ncbi:MAG TPA: sulfite exporter TauE/SafE family protein [Micromonosporaceae bacterium]|nr:sulfite exporter TauE/SafE family protein [Micromonosporaceae bacterium]